MSYTHFLEVYDWTGWFPAGLWIFMLRSPHEIFETGMFYTHFLEVYDWTDVGLWIFILRSSHEVFMMVKYIFWEVFIQLNCILAPAPFDSWPEKNITCGRLASKSPPHDFAFITNGTTCRLCRRPDGFPASTGEHQYYGSHWRRPGTGFGIGYIYIMRNQHCNFAHKICK